MPHLIPLAILVIVTIAEILHINKTKKKERDTMLFVNESFVHFVDIGIHGDKQYGIYIRSWKNPLELCLAWTIFSVSSYKEQKLVKVFQGNRLWINYNTRGKAFYQSFRIDKKGRIYIPVMEFIRHTGFSEGTWHIKIGRLWIVRHSTNVHGVPFTPFVIDWRAKL